jgi:sugar phosphate isomerase/epimerase
MKRRQFVKSTGGALFFSSLPGGLQLVDQTGAQSEYSPKICIFSKHLQWLGYEEMARFARETGFTGIDLTVRDGGHVAPENASRDLPGAIHQIRDAGLEVPMITTGITDPDDPLTWKILESAGKLGVPVYRPGWFRYREGTRVQEQLDRAASKLKKLQEVNRSANIAASYQNHSGNYIGSSGWDLLRIVEGLDPKWIGIQFDIRHAMVEGPESWPFVLEMIAPYINSLDIKDYTWDTSDEVTVRNVPLGQGLVPFPSYLDRLKKLGIQADFSMHFEYALGGAEHGSDTLGISREAFQRQIRADLQYFQSLL